MGLFQGCWFYSMKGSLPAHIHSISLAPVTNESTEFAAAVILNEELNEFMVSAAANSVDSFVTGAREIL
jgi:hypothetical protein